MDTRQKKVLKEELQLMRNGLMKDMEIMLGKTLLDKMKTMIKEEISDEKDRLLKIVENIQKIKSDIGKTVDFMSEKFEVIIHESKELKSKVTMLVKENKMLNDQLNDMKEETTSLSSQVDFLERNLKGKNLEIVGVPFVKNENVGDLALKVLTNIDPQLSKEDIESARRLMKKDKNNVTIYGPILARFKNIGKRNYIFRNKKNLAEARPNLVNGSVKKIFINENLTPKNKKIFYHANCFKKQNNWRFVWTANGMVFLRKTESSDAVLVKNLVDLENIIC